VAAEAGADAMHANRHRPRLRPAQPGKGFSDWPKSVWSRPYSIPAAMLCDLSSNRLAQVQTDDALWRSLMLAVDTLPISAMLVHSADSHTIQGVRPMAITGSERRYPRLPLARRQPLPALGLCPTPARGPQRLTRPAHPPDPVQLPACPRGLLSSPAWLPRAARAADHAPALE
jgi:hypothetical protein